MQSWGYRAEASLNKGVQSPRPAAAELFPPFPGKTPEYVQGLERLEEGPWSHTSNSTQANLVPAGQPGWSWPRAPFRKLSIVLPEIPHLSRPPLLFSFLTSVRREIPAEGMGDTSSSLQEAAWQLLQKGPQCPTHTGPPTKLWPLIPSHRLSPETADGAESMESGTASGAIAAWSAVYIDLNQAHLGRAGRQGKAAQVS